MFIELVDLLRCPRPHELAWLVVAAHRMVDRDIEEGELGCSVCGGRYPITRGVADLRGGEPGADAPPAGDPADSGELAVRAAALLGLTDSSGVAALAGVWTRAARGVAAITERIHILAIDPATQLASGGGVSLARAGTRLPLRPEAVRGIALDAAHATAAMLESAVEALTAGGRLLVPAEVPLPAGVTELARDAAYWLAEKGTAAGPVVQLRVVRGERAP